MNLNGVRVVVTGGAGFLGSRIVRVLEVRGAHVVVPRKRDYDLVDRAAARRLLESIKPDLIVHAAAVVGGIGLNRDHPGSLFFENLLIGAHTMEEARLAGVSKFVSIGTVCSYPKYTATPFSEDDLWSGYPEETNAPYGLAKKMLLVQGQAYRREYGMNAIFLMPTNLYGPGDNSDLGTSHVIPAIIRKCLESKNEIVVWGSGNATREFLYVDDCAEAVVLACERYDKSEPVNIGSGREISIADLVEMVRKLTGATAPVRWDKSKPDGQPRRRVDTARAQREFGFTALVPFEDGLRRTVEAYR